MEVRDWQDVLEPIAKALTMIGEALTAIASNELRKFSLTNPPRRETTDATVTTLKSAEDRIREDQQGENPDEPIEEWVGFREQAFAEGGSSLVGPAKDRYRKGAGSHRAKG